MWITGLDALRKPLLHLHTQADAALPWATIDMDFMNLNQAAHGDREYGFVLTRLRAPRTTVAGHVSNPAVRARIGSWVRAAVGAAAARSLKLARFGDNMRDVAVTEGDKVEAELRFGVSVNTWGVNDLVAVVESVEDAAVDALIAEYGDLYDMDDDLRPGGARHDSVRYQARVEAALRQFLTEGGFGAFTTNFEDLGGLRQLPGLAVQRLMADGYGFGGEGDWKTSALLRDPEDRRRPACPAAPRSWRTTPTTCRRTGRRSSARTCSRSARPSPPSRPRLEVHPLGIGGREDPARLVFTADPGAGRRRRLVRPGRPVPLGGRRDRRRRAVGAAAQPAGGPGGVGAAPGLRDGDRGLADRRRAAPHGAEHPAGRRRAHRPGRGVLDRAGAHRRRHHAPVAGQGAALERRLPPPRPAPVGPAGTFCTESPRGRGDFLYRKSLEGVAGDGAAHAPRAAPAAAEFRARDRHDLDAGRLERGVGDGVPLVGHRDPRGHGEGVVAVVPLLALGGDRVEPGVDHPQAVDAHRGGGGHDERLRPGHGQLDVLGVVPHARAARSPSTPAASRRRRGT